MRALFALAVLTLGIAGLTPARAADLVEPDTDGVSYGGGWTHGVRVAPVVLYDYELGVIVRSYWLSPWRHRHYFPVTGQRPARRTARRSLRRRRRAATGGNVLPSLVDDRSVTAPRAAHPHSRARARR